MPAASAEPGGGKVDPLLASFLAPLDDDEWQRLLTPLVTEHIQPVVSGVVHRRLGGARQQASVGMERGFDEAGSEALVRVIARLRAMTCGGEPVADLRAYVAVTTFHACDDYLRRKYPQRARLKNRLRYALTHVPGLGLWADPAGDWLAGLAEWREQPPSDAAYSRQDPGAFREAALPAGGEGRTNAFRLLPRLLRAIGHPIGLDALVGTVAELWGVRDSTAERDGDAQRLVDRQADPRPNAATAMERRLYLERLWAEIRELPLRQRVALLLNMRDGEGGAALSLFPLTGVATLRGLAEAVGQPAAAFATLWNDLPLDDAVIAGRLGLTRQQVINLRKSARERLARRMKNAGF